MRGLVSFLLPCFLHAGPAADDRAGAYLADIGPAPAVELIDQDGKAFRIADRRGKAVLVGFVYTTCSGTCPITTHRMAAARDALKKAGLWGDRVEFVSVSLDPARDRPDVLKSYAGLYDADVPAWRFLTGETEPVARVIESWGMWARTNAQGVLDHPSRVFLIDPSGRQREIYNLDFLEPEAIVRDIRSVLGEGAGD